MREYPDFLRDVLIEELSRVIMDYEATDTDTGEPRPLDQEDAEIIAEDIATRLLPIHLIPRP